MNCCLIVLAKDNITECEVPSKTFQVLNLNVLSYQFTINHKVEEAR